MIIIASDVVSGPTKGILQLIDFNRRKNVSYFLYNFKTYKQEPTAFLAEARRLDIRTYLFNQGYKQYFSVLSQMLNEIIEKKINIVQTHGYKPAVMGMFAKWIGGVKWICTMHGVTHEGLKASIYHFIEKSVQLYADRVVLVSRAQLDRIPRGRTSCRIQVIHNAVDPQRPAPISQNWHRVREDLRIKQSDPLISVIGRLSPEKGVDTFIKAFDRAVQSIPQACGLIVGDGQERIRLENQARDLGLKGKILFLRHTETPGDFISASDLIILPSRTEGLPNLALEAMALGKPIIATRVGGITELIEHNSSGLLVPPDNPTALAVAMVEVLGNPQLAERLSRAGLLRVQKYFTPESRANAWLALYHDTLLNQDKK